MSTLKLTSPFIITPRLKPGVQIGGAFISLEPTGRRDRDGKPQWWFAIDLPGGVGHEDNDLHGNGGYEEMLRALLSFLTAAAESYRYREFYLKRDKIDPDSNESLFPPNVVEWAYQNDNDITSIQLELEDRDDLVEVER